MTVAQLEVRLSIRDMWHMLKGKGGSEEKRARYFTRRMIGCSAVCWGEETRLGVVAPIDHSAGTSAVWHAVCQTASQFVICACGEEAAHHSLSARGLSLEERFSEINLAMMV